MPAVGDDKGQKVRLDEYQSGGNALPASTLLARLDGSTPYSLLLGSQLPPSPKEIYSPSLLFVSVPCRRNQDVRLDSPRLRLECELPGRNMRSLPLLSTKQVTRSCSAECGITWRWAHTSDITGALLDHVSMLWQLGRAARSYHHVPDICPSTVSCVDIHPYIHSNTTC